MSANVVNKHNFIYLLAIFVLLLMSLINLNYVFRKSVVLGAKTQNNQESEFWNKFLSTNPNYVPGLIEFGEIDKAKAIDPNFSGLK